MSEIGEIELLLVEDNPSDVTITLRALRKANIVNGVQVARDGAEALAFIFGEGAPSSDAQGAQGIGVQDIGMQDIGMQNLENLPRLILLDLKLPKIDGFGVLRRLRTDPRTRLIPVVIFTSSREQRDVAEGYRLGVNSYIVKPMSFEGFLEAVGKLGAYWLRLNQPPY